MPLTNEERQFLDAYVYEATHEPFGGPATRDLRARQIYYSDLHGILTAYHRELTGAHKAPFGKHNSSPPPSPWASREEAELRNRAMLQEYLGTSANARQKPPVQKTKQQDDGHVPVSGGKAG